MEKDSVLIKRYMHFQLSNDELADFEERILMDIEFAKKVQTYQDIEHITRQSTQSVEEREQLETWSTMLSEKRKHTNKKISWKWIGGIAAGFILVLGMWQLNQIIRSPNLDTLVAVSWNKNVGLDYEEIRGEDNDSLQRLILTGYKEYKNENYRVALLTLKDFNTDTSNYEDALLLRGLSLYKTGKIQEAIQTLNSLSTYPTRKKAKAARWYLGLIYLEQGDLLSAEKFLEIPEYTNQPIKLKKY